MCSCSYLEAVANYQHQLEELRKSDAEDYHILKIRLETDIQNLEQHLEVCESIDSSGYWLATAFCACLLSHMEGTVTLSCLKRASLKHICKLHARMLMPSRIYTPYKHTCARTCAHTHQAMRATYQLNTEKLEYNYRVLVERDHENQVGCKQWHSLALLSAFICDTLSFAAMLLSGCFTMLWAPEPPQSLHCRSAT